MDKFINKVIQGDCLIKLKELDDNSIDSIVTDPPYHLVSIVKRFGKENSAPAKFGTDGAFLRASKGFMGKDWDGVNEDGIGIAQKVELWKECLRVLKPGGYLLAFGGTRTYHRMAVAIEDAGFEVRDMIEWVYGSGFPKSLNIGKAVDKLQGNKRVKIAQGTSGKPESHSVMNMAYEEGSKSIMGGDYDITKGTSEWEGWGTALKPSHEPICMARKPISEKNVAENCLKWGTGGINIDESRVESNEQIETGRAGRSGASNFNASIGEEQPNHSARFPANLIHDNSEEVRECFPKAGKGNGKGAYNYSGREYDNKDTSMFNGDKPQAPSNFNDSGNASRYFKSIIYTAKASKSERNKGCEGLDEKANIYMARANGTGGIQPGMERFATLPKANNHPTVKPIALMEYLIKMVTPKGGIVLDPFMGSGTTGIACRKLNYGFIGIELEPDYITIAKARIDSIKAVQEKLL